MVLRVIPAIDIKDGRCVRLYQGDYSNQTIYSGDPVAQAAEWAKAGARLIHVVDLDGAKAGHPVNLHLALEIAKTTGAAVELGGGIRSLDTIDKVLSAGIDRVILGTAAVESPNLVARALAKWGPRIVVGIDARGGRVAVSGWENQTGVDAYEFGAGMAKLGVREIVFTDISRDGTLSGVNAEAVARMASRSGAEVIASGGVSSIEDIASLLSLEPLGVTGVIVGKALYTGKVDLAYAIKLCSGTAEACAQPAGAHGGFPGGCQDGETADPPGRDGR